jgi:hypothetical protein
MKIFQQRNKYQAEDAETGKEQRAVKRQETIVLGRETGLASQKGNDH